MPKNVENDKNKDKNDNIVSAEAGAATIPVAAPAPAAANIPPAESVEVGASTPVTPVAAIRSRRLGTGVIIGISAAGVALLAGVFGGGIALGAVTASHGPAGISHGMDEAGSRMQGGQMQGGQMQGGQMPGGEKQRGQMPDRPGMLPQERDAQGMKMIPGGTPGQNVPTAAPIPTN